VPLLEHLVTMEVHVSMIKMVFNRVNARMVLLEVIVKQTLMIVPMVLVNMELFVMIVLPIIAVPVRKVSLDQTVTLTSMSVLVIPVFVAHVLIL